jgi:hypothetical protein
MKEGMKYHEVMMMLSCARSIQMPLAKPSRSEQGAHDMHAQARAE